MTVSDDSELSLLVRIGLGALSVAFTIYVIFACVAIIFIIFMLIASPIAVVMGAAGSAETLIAECEGVVLVLACYMAILHL